MAWTLKGGGRGKGEGPAIKEKKTFFFFLFVALVKKNILTKMTYRKFIENSYSSVQCYGGGH